MLVSSTLLIVTSLAVRRYSWSWCVEVASARCGILHHSNNILKSLQMVWDPSTWDYQSWSLSTILLKLASCFSHCLWQGVEDPEDSLGGENPHLCCQMMGGRQVLKSLQTLGELLSWRLTWLNGKATTWHTPCWKYRTQSRREDEDHTKEKRTGRQWEMHQFWCIPSFTLSCTVLTHIHSCLPSPKIWTPTLKGVKGVPQSTFFPHSFSPILSTVRENFQTTRNQGWKQGMRLPVKVRLTLLISLCAMQCWSSNQIYMYNLYIFHVRGRDVGCF
jgi:hypothetical protein